MTHDARSRGILMTDLEGSTRHLRALGDDYSATLARHHDIIKTAFAGEGGVEVGSEGDSFAVVFDSAGGALRAAVGAQRDLAAQSWPDAPWRVRMAVHVGDVERGDAGAVGMALHHAARLRGVAHGGQILVSEPARLAFGDRLPADVLLADLGEHTIRDFLRPVRLHDVRGPGIADTFPPLRTAAARAIPAAHTPFVGRTAELAELLEVMAAHRLVTVTGPGGSGKTRLAYEAARLADVEGVRVVELAGVRTGRQAMSAVVSALGAPGPEAVAEIIGARELLVVLDNCEHVVDEIAQLVSMLIDGCEGLSVLATSREPLRVKGEVVWNLPVLAADEAVALLATLSPRPIDLDAAGSACDLLGRIPLAIELAAARLRSLPLDELVARLDDQLAVLTTGARDQPRHQTLRATLDWSYELLSADEQHVLPRLGVFARGLSLPAAEAVTPLDDLALLDAIDGLVAKSLVETDLATGRYHLLEPIRQYAVARLTVSGDHDTTHEAFVSWAARFARTTSRDFFTDQQRVTGAFREELDNLGAAMAWALDHDRPDQAAAIFSGLSYFWYFDARHDGDLWVPALLERLDELEPLQRAHVLLAAGVIRCDDLTSSDPTAWLSDAADIFRTAQRPRPLFTALHWLCRASAVRIDNHAASAAIEEAVAITEEIGDRFGWGWAMIWRGILRADSGDLDGSATIMLDVIARCEDLPHVVGGAWGELADIDLTRGNLDAADDHINRCIEIYRDIGDRWQLGVALGKRAEIRFDRDPVSSAGSVIDSMRALRDIGADLSLSLTIRRAAFLLLRVGQDPQAATLMGSVAGVEFRWEPETWPPEMHEMLLATATVASDPRWEAEVARGGRLGLFDATDAAVSWLEHAYPRPSDQ